MSQIEQTDYRVRQVVNIVTEQPNQSVAGLAREIGLSTSRLEHIFKKQSGIRLSRFIQHHKLDKAANLLSTSPLRVKEIAARVGYEHTASFVRAFKEKYKMTPKHYRSATRFPPISAAV